jgi:hypothetical protein
LRVLRPPTRPPCGGLLPELPQVELVVTQEAATLAALYEDASAYPEPVGENLRWLLRDYCRHVIKYAWPLQRKGIVPVQGGIALTAFMQKLIAFEPQTNSEEHLLAETLRQYNRLQEYRELRRYSTGAGIPAVNLSPRWPFLAGTATGPKEVSREVPM